MKIDTDRFNEQEGWERKKERKSSVTSSERGRTCVQEEMTLDIFLLQSL